MNVPPPYAAPRPILEAVEPEEDDDDEVPPLAHEIHEVNRPAREPQQREQPAVGGHAHPWHAHPWGIRPGRPANGAAGGANDAGDTPRQPSPEPVNTQPGRAPTMRTTPDSDARRVYYRVYSTRQGATILQARMPISHADPALTYIQPIIHLAPPYTVKNITRVLCNREGVHPSRATLYLTAPRGAIHPPAPDMRVDVFSETGNCPGIRQNDPMMFVVEMNGDPDDDISQPLSAGASCGRWWRTGCIGRSVACLFTCPCNACGVWCDICMEDCQRNFARRPEATSTASII